MQPDLVNMEDFCSVPTVIPTRLWGSRRLTIAILSLLGTMTMVMNQSQLIAFALVCMIKSSSFGCDFANLNSSYSTSDSNSNISECAMNSTQNGEDLGEFEWDKEIQGRLLSAEFYGCMVTQIFGGWLADKLGGKRLIVASTFIAGLSTVVSPSIARLSVNMLFGMRLLNGLAFGIMYPALFPLLGAWTLPIEQGIMVGIAFAGFGIAGTINNPISALLCKYGGGWTSIFYFNGSLVLAWSIIALFFLHDGPVQDPFISVAEKNHLLSSKDSKPSQRKNPTPWLAIFTSVPIWAVVCTAFFVFAAFQSAILNLPTFLRDAMGFTVQENGLMSATPAFAALGIHFLVGPFFDYVRRKQLMSLTLQRKIFNSIGTFCPAVAFIIVSQLPADYRFIVVAVLAVGQACMEFAILGGFTFAFLDMAPQYVGVLQGISNTIANSAGFLMPMIITNITKNGTQQEWSYVMLLIAGLYATAGSIFILFSSSGRQAWDKSTESS